jgi:hypothetical protein
MRRVGERVALRQVVGVGALVGALHEAAFKAPAG